MLSREEWEALTAYAAARMGARRLDHTLSVAETAARLAPLLGADEDDAARAGLLHDVTKEWETERQLRYCRERGIILREDEEKTPNVLHAATAADLVRRELGVSAAAAGAVRWHCTGRAGMTPLETTVFLADYTEPLRTHETCRKAGEILRSQGADEAMRFVLDHEILHQVERGAPLCLYTAEARNDWINRRQKGDVSPARKEHQ